MGVAEPGGANCWSPWRHLQDHHTGVEVFEAELPPGWLGCLDPGRRVIWIATGLTQAERRCTLAHEVGHLERGPVPTDPVLLAAEERAVDQWAATRLIPTAALLTAVQWSSHLHEIAEELHVDQRMLRARLQCLDLDERDDVIEAIRRRAAA